MSTADSASAECTDDPRTAYQILCDAPMEQGDRLDFFGIAFSISHLEADTDQAQCMPGESMMMAGRVVSRTHTTFSSWITMRNP